MTADPELEDLIKRARQHWQDMTPAERTDMFRAQKRSFVRAEAGFGSDADEAEYRAARASGDADKIAECERKEAERIDLAEDVLKEMGL